ncbi:MAG: GLPGLI family protein [Bacteroidota bacterium]
MTKYVILAYFAILSLHGFAQTEAIVTYNFESFGDFKIETTLRIKGSKSYYSHYQENVEINTDDGYTFWHYKNDIDWYRDGETGEIFEQREKYKYPVLNAQHPATIEWEILEETMMIAGFKAQKAITTPLKEDETTAPYGQLIAWFTTELPFDTGPERYFGLPGLIIKIQYTGRRESCTLKEIRFREVADWTIKNEGIKVTSEQLIDPFEINKKWLKEQKKKGK